MPSLTLRSAYQTFMVTQVFRALAQFFLPIRSGFTSSGVTTLNETQSLTRRVSGAQLFSLTIFVAAFGLGAYSSKARRLMLWTFSVYNVIICVLVYQSTSSTALQSLERGLRYFVCILHLSWFLMSIRDLRDGIAMDPFAKFLESAPGGLT